MHAQGHALAIASSVCLLVSTHTHIYVTTALGGMDGEVALVGSRECGRL